MDKRRLGGVLLLVLAFVISVLPIVNSRFISVREQQEVIEEFLGGGEEDQARPSRMDVSIQSLKVLGVLEAPSIGLEMPIYEGVTEAALSSACGTMVEFGGFTGKKGSHPVMTSHNGMPGRNLFSGITKMKKGDEFYITTEDDRMLVYKVYKLDTVVPTDVNAFERGRDVSSATLLTCVPEGINSHRLLVKGRLIEDIDLTSEDEGYEKQDERFVLTNYEIFVIALWSVVLLVFVVLTVRDKVKKKGDLI